MRLRDTAGLVERAKEHREADRFLKGKYLRYLNGTDQEFQGCEIGCLAMPVKVADREELFEVDHPSLRDEERLDEATLIEIIEADFGVVVGLQRVAEGIFEGSLTNEEGADFVVAFTEALASLGDGYPIDNGLVESWVNSRKDEDDPTFPWYNGTEEDDDFNVNLRVSQTGNETRYLAERDAFLSWIKEGCPAVAVPEPA